MDVKKPFLNLVRKIRRKDVEKAVRNKRKIKRRASKGLLRNFFDDVQTLIDMLNDYVKGRYPYLPWWTVASICSALVWILNPADLVPDALPFVGLMDDVMCLTIALAMAEQDIKDYKLWQKQQTHEQEKTNKKDKVKNDSSSRN